MHKDTMHGPGSHWCLKHDNNFPIHIYRIEWLQKLDRSVEWSLLWKKRLVLCSNVNVLFMNVHLVQKGVLHFKCQMKRLFCRHLPDWQRTSKFLNRILYEVTKHFSPVGLQSVVQNTSDQQHLCIALLLCMRTEQMQRGKGGGKEKVSACVTTMYVLMNLLWLFLGYDLQPDD